MTQPRADRAKEGVRRARKTAKSLLPDSGDLDQLVLAVSAHRGRLITVQSWRLEADAPSGIWLQAADRDYVLHAANLGPEHRAAVVCHELAHMLLGHQSREGVVDVRGVAPSIDPVVAARFFTRHGYEDDIEAEAEDLGTRLAADLARNAAAHAPQDDVISTRLR